MPNKTVSFSDETYIEMVELKPEDMSHSEWIDTLVKNGLQHIGDVEEVDIPSNN